MKFEKLKNIVEVKKGKKPSFVETPDENSIRVLQIDDLRNDTNPKFTNDKTGVLAKEDDVLIAWDGANAGTIGYGKLGYIGSTIALLRKKQPDLYSTTFIGIFLQSQYQYLRSKTTGATIPHISKKALDELEVPVIGVSDQLHIANLLSKAETLIAQRKESIRLLDEFLKSTFLEMFGDPAFNLKNWNKLKFKDLIAKGDKINYGIVQPGEDGNKEGVAIIRVGDFDGIRINANNLKLVDPVIEQKHKASRLVGDELLIACVGATIGKIALADVSHAGKNIVRAIARIRCDTQKMNRLYLCQLLLTGFYQFNLKNLARTIAQPTLNIGQIEELKIIVPPIELQTQFAQIVEKTEVLKTQYQQSLQELENLYGSLSQKAFRGELSIKDESLLSSVEHSRNMAAEPVVKYSK